MKLSTLITTTVLVLTIILPNKCLAQWSNDFSKNTQITPTGLSYYDSDVRTISDGTTYVMFVLGGGNTLQFRLQIVGKDGKRKLARGGQTYSHEANKTWVGYNQWLATDVDDNAILGVQDFRCHPDSMLNTYAIYKYDKDGNEIWGNKVLEDSVGHGMEAGLSIACLEDGTYLFAWEYTGEDNDVVHAERLDANGNTLWSKDLVETSRGSFPYPFVIDMGNGQAMLLYLYDSGSINSRIIDYDGNTISKSDQTVYSNGFASPKPLEVLHVKKGPDRGAIITCCSSDNQAVTVYVNSDGRPAFGSTGELQLNNTDAASQEPSVVYNDENGNFSAAYSIVNMDDYSIQGLNMVNFDKDGEFLDEVPNAIEDYAGGYKYSFYSLQNYKDGGVALFYQKYDETTGNVGAYMALFDKDGNRIGQPVAFSTSETSKTNLRSSQLIDNSYYLTSWDEKRNGTTSIFMQKVDVSLATGIDRINKDSQNNVVDKFIYSVDGRRVGAPQNGIYLIKTIYADGSSKMEKRMFRK